MPQESCKTAGYESHELALDCLDRGSRETSGRAPYLRAALVCRLLLDVCGAGIALRDAGRFLWRRRRGLFRRTDVYRVQHRVCGVQRRWGRQRRDGAGALAVSAGGRTARENISSMNHLEAAVELRCLVETREAKFLAIPEAAASLASGPDKWSR